MINEKAHRMDELRRAEEMVDTLINVDFSGTYDDRRPLEAMKVYIADRRVALDEEERASGDT